MSGSHRRPGSGRLWSGVVRSKRRTLFAAVVVGGLLAGLGIPQVASAADVAAEFDWVMPERTHWNDEYQSVDITEPSRAYLSPTSWPVTLDACASAGGIKMTFAIQLSDRVETIERPWTSQSCTVDYTFPHLGHFPTTLTVRSILGEESVVSKTVIVRDFLVVSMGDSVASGEGNPDVAGPPLWYDRRCHRSGKSGAARAARSLEQRYHQFSVTFLSVACSGASITKGLMGEYEGQEQTGPFGPMPPQVKQVGWLLCPENVTCNSKHDIRYIDALVVNAGANDLHFSDIVFDCAYPDPSTPCHAEDDVEEQLRDDLAALPGKLDALAGMIDDWLRYATVHVGEYFDPTRNQHGDFCTMDVGPGTINSAESAWAFLEVVSPLNTELGKATARHHQKGWQYLGGVMDKFHTHGYCASSPYIVTYDESNANQRNRDGTMHPNWAGQGIYAEALLSAWGA